MSLVRHWYPTSNKSSRSGTPRLLVIHTTEGFTGQNGMYDCAVYFQGPVGASSHVVIDNYHPGHICECVSASYASWTQCNYNGATAASVEQCGYASWSRSEWLNNKESLLRNTAAWLSEESVRWNIPLTDLSSSSAQGSGRGVCYHSELGSTGCGHSDPGSGYPLDIVLDWAKGTTTPPKPVIEVEDVSSSVVSYKGKLYFAYINPSGRVCVNGGEVDPNSNAKGGIGLDIDKDTGHKVISFTNQGGTICSYEQQEGSREWVWMDRGWEAK